MIGAIPVTKNIADGDIVRLNSGGPLMTSSGCPNPLNYIKCFWFSEDQQIHEAMFHKDAVMRIEE
jgi:uncharacterized protein YodC (DUF2158 family)